MPCQTSRKVGKKVLCYMVIHLAYVDDGRKVVESLMRQHKLQGTIDDWLPGYKAELESVINKKCREITGEEYKRVLKNTKAVKLLMNPRPTRVGARK